MIYTNTPSNWSRLRFELYVSFRNAHFGGMFYSAAILYSYCIEFTLKSILSTIECKLSNKEHSFINRSHDLVQLYNLAIRHKLLKMDTIPNTFLKYIENQSLRYPKNRFEFFNTLGSWTEGLGSIIFLDSLVLKLDDFFFFREDQENSIFLQAINSINYDNLVGQLFFHQNVHANKRLKDNISKYEKDNPRLNELFSKGETFKHPSISKVIVNESMLDYEEIANLTTVDKFKMNTPTSYAMPDLIKSELRHN